MAAAKVAGPNIDISAHADRRQGFSNKCVDDFALPRISPCSDDASRPSSASPGAVRRKITFPQPVSFETISQKVKGRSNSFPRSRKTGAVESNNVLVRSPLAVRKLEPLPQRSSLPEPKEKPKEKAKLSPLLRGKTLPALQVSRPAIIVTDVDSMPRIQKGQQASKLESTSLPQN